MQNHIQFKRSPKKDILGTSGGIIIYACPFLALAQHLIDTTGDKISSEMDHDVITCEYSHVLRDRCNTSVNLF